MLMNLQPLSLRRPVTTRDSKVVRGATKLMPSDASFKKDHIDALFGELNSDYKDMQESEQLHRDAHLAIAYFDAGRDIPDTIDPRVHELLEKHGPSSE